MWARPTRRRATIRAPPGWQASDARRVIVPTGGRRGHDTLRARLLGSLCRTGHREVTFLRVVPTAATDEIATRMGREVERQAREEVRGRPTTRVIRSDDVPAVILEHAAECDLIVLGLQRFSRRRKLFGELALRIARDTPCAIIMISRRG